MKALLLAITKLAVFDALLQERNRNLQYKNFASWNEFPKSIRNLKIERTLNKSSRQEQLDNNDDTIRVYYILLFMRMHENSSLEAVLRQFRETFEMKSK